MFELIERLRQKPEKEKKRIALITAFSVALIIFLVWLSVVMPSMFREPTEKEEVKVKEPISFLDVKKIFISGFNEIKENAAGLKETFSSFSTSPEYYTSTSTKR